MKTNTFYKILCAVLFLTTGYMSFSFEKQRKINDKQKMTVSSMQKYINYSDSIYREKIVLVNESLGKVIDVDYIKCLSDAETPLISMNKNEELWFFRIIETNCSSCITTQIKQYCKLLEENNKILLISTMTSLSSLLTLIRVNNIPIGNVFTVNGVFNVAPFDSLRIPYYFKINQDFTIIKLIPFDENIEIEKIIY